MFGRKKAPAATAATGDAGRVAWLSSTPPVFPDQQPGNALTDGWAPFGAGQHPSSQIGAYTGTRPSRFPAMPAGVMRSCVVEGLSSRLYYPTVNPVAQQNPLIVSRQHANLAGGQRRGQQFTGPIGPTNVQRFQAQIVAAQVRQTGIAAAAWARPLVD